MRVLDMADVGRVTWLCKQLDPSQLLGADPPPLSQSVLLSLMQQLGSELAQVRRGAPLLGWLFLCLGAVPGCAAATWWANVAGL